MQFGKMNWGDLSGSFLKVGMIGYLYLNQNLTVASTIIAFILVPLTVFVFALAQTRLNFLTFKPKNFKLNSQTLFRFSGWIFVSEVCVGTIGTVEYSLLGRLSSPESIGVLSAAQRLALAFGLLSSSLTTSLLHKVAQFQTSKQFRSFLKSSLPLLLISACAFYS